MNDDQIEIGAQAAAEAMNGGSWRTGNWYTEEHKNAWRKAIRAAVEAMATTTRMCVNCGMVVDASRFKPGDTMPQCRGVVDGVELAACTFDLTPEEAWQHWRAREHTNRRRLDELEVRLKAMEQLIQPALPGEEGA